MKFAVSFAWLIGMIVTVMLFLADYASWTNDTELAYEIAAHDLRHLLADCGENLVCNTPPSTACRHTNDVVEIHADLGPRRRFPMGVASADASLYFDPTTLGVDVRAVRQCAP